jgi:acetate kinase
MNKKILVINSGSSSLKYKVVEENTLVEIASGICERIGIDGIFSIKHNGNKEEHKISFPDHITAVNTVLSVLKDKGVVVSFEDIKGIGHRVVHGSTIFKESSIIKEKELEQIKECSTLAPLHNPGAAAGIEAFMKISPSTLNVACFDTSFHQSIPDYNHTYSVPLEWKDKYSVRKYGAHGISYQYITEKMKELEQKEEVNLIICHIGNGASICAVKDSKSYDTTMGLTPLAGLVMGTRSGDIDPSIHNYVSKVSGLSLAEIENTLLKESGLKGLTGTSDMRDVTSQFENNNPDAQLAIKVWAKRIASYIANYYNQLEGKVDAIVFTAGIGENSPMIKHVLENVFFLKNSYNPSLLSEKYEDNIIISNSDSKTKIIKIKTDEERMIAKEVERLHDKR